LDRGRAFVLDQFEQLSPSKSAHAAIFQLLKHAAVLAMPPHRVTYIVAFRADYSSTWLNFEYDQFGGRGPIIVPVRLFSENQSKDIIAVISEAAGFTIDNALVEDLVASMKNEEDRISPVDIGITLLALNERALTKESRHLDKGDYRIAGGATGLLAEYISSVLDRYPVGERSTVVQAMLELADLSSDKRLAQGLSPDKLADKVKLPVTTLQRYLNDLASPQMRLLEFLSSSGTYRLSHERLIPALRQLAGLVLARAEQAGRIFDRAYGDWVGGQRSWRQRRAL
jgi:transcriptional regulator with XRE-family HTH domain